MRKTLVINAVGLTQSLLERMPNTRRVGKALTIGHVTPAVTCPVQATYLTGTLPREHGIVGNGWYFRDQCEIRFWHQSDRLVQRPRVWEIARRRDSSFTCANICWWNAMYCSADITVTPRPMYPADGRKIPDLWTHPADLRSVLQSELGPFPLFRFWGPATSIESSQWIANAAIRVDQGFSPSLSLVYLPHLDYALQRYGPESERIQPDLAELDDVIGSLLNYFLNERHARVIILSEYGIERVHTPVHINRTLRQAGFVAIREELGRELLDAGASAAFAVTDHQVAHVYVNDVSRAAEVQTLLAGCAGVDTILDRHAQFRIGIDHDRTGELIAIAAPGQWFTYYYWLDDARAPDFARTVDIHRKPGYDPAELFMDPNLFWPQAKVAWRLLQRRLGFRSLLDVIPLDASLVRGSHGRPPTSTDAAPILINSQPTARADAVIAPTDVCSLILETVGI